MSVNSDRLFSLDSSTNITELLLNVVINTIKLTLISDSTMSYNFQQIQILLFFFIKNNQPPPPQIADTIPLKVYMEYGTLNRVHLDIIVLVCSNSRENGNKNKQFKLRLSFVRFYSIKCLFSQFFEIHIYYSHECFQGK